MVGLYPSERSFSAFRDVIQQWSPNTDFPSDDFLLKRSSPTEDAWFEYYIPFDYVEQKAKIIILGITPGTTQWTNAVRVAHEGLLKGWSDEAILKETKQFGAFSGSMRPWLVKMLDIVGVNRIAGVSSCAQLFDPNDKHAHHTSCFCHPIFDGHHKGYAGASMQPKIPLFQESFLSGFLKEAQAIPNAYIIPLGSAGKITEYAVKKGWIEEDRFIRGLPHASQANLGRVQYFCGEKSRDSFKLFKADGSKSANNPDKVDEGKAAAVNKVNQILHSY